MFAKKVSILVKSISIVELKPLVMANIYTQNLNIP